MLKKIRQINFSEKLSLFKAFKEKYRLPFFISKVIFSCLVIFYVVTLIDWQKLVYIFYKINVGYFFVALLVTFLVSLIYNLRYLVILRKKGIGISFLNLYLINRFSNLVNFILPGGLGQETGRLIYISDKKVALATSIYDRLLGLLSIVLVLLVSALLIKIRVLYLIIIALVFIGVLLVNLYLMKIWKLNFFLPFILSVVYSIGLVLISFIEFKTVGYNISLLRLLFFASLVHLALMVPVSVNGYGLREYLWFIFLGVSIEFVVVYSLIGYIIGFILSLPGLVTIFKKKW
ncbi:MAG: lysylphosphatidylglycerol synthase domain-containing protein [Patescibacteria group bacterium]